MSEIIIHEIYHLCFYLLVLFLLLTFFSIDFKLTNIFYGFIATIFIDLDHLIDYFIYKNSFVINIREFLTYNYFDANGKVYVIFHAWGWILILLAIYILSKKRSKILFFVIVGMVAHVVFDIIFYGFDPRAYMISYRYLHNFSNTIFYTLY